MTHDYSHIPSPSSDLHSILRLVQILDNNTVAPIYPGWTTISL